MNPKLLLLAALLCAVGQISVAQDKSTAKFGNISPKDFEPKTYSIDSNANAIVIADIGSSYIDGNRNGWFSVQHTHYKRAHILNKNGYDIADVSIQLYEDGDDKVVLDRLKATTYNLENGKVVETKLDVKGNVFLEKQDKFYSVKKFTFPNLKEGCIIEFEYTTISDFISQLVPWDFQGSYPCLWSDYTASIPSFFYYVFLSQGYLPFDIKTEKSSTSSFSGSVPGGSERNEHFSITSRVTDYRWVIKNVPALKEESFTSSVDNYIAKIQFLLSTRQDPLSYYEYIESWPKMTSRLMEWEYFGSQLNRDNGWLGDVMTPNALTSGTKLEKARKIFNYVRDNFTCTSHYDQSPSLSQPLKNVLKTRKGTVTDINLLLAAMLKHEDIDTDPLILGTRSHGFVYTPSPILTQFNYLICQSVIDGNTYYLDASRPGMGFGHLPLDCYNGFSRLINKEAGSVEFSADSVMEKKFTSVMFSNDEKGNFIGRAQQIPGYYESYHLRQKIREKGEEQYLKDLKEKFSGDVDISNPKIDSLNKPEFPLNITYDIDMKSEKEDIVYINPMFGEGVKENPFKSAERRYPVEMPCAMDNLYSLQFDIPEGYVVDEIPQPILVKLDDQGSGLFEFRTSNSGGVINVRSRIVFNRTFFTPDEYEGLREFYNLIVKKQSEQIVLKKKK